MALVLILGSSQRFALERTAELASPSIVEIRVSASSDDAEESATGSMSLASGDLELVTESTVQTVGVRFNGVAVPPGATILGAYVQFQVDEASASQTDLVVQGHAADNAAVFTGSSRNISLRPRTTAAVAWSPPAWPTVGAAGPDQRTPDLAAVIQEIVERPGWASGNSIVLVVTGSGKRTAKAFDSLPAGAPLLHVEYGSGDGNLPPQVTIAAPAEGARFERGAVVALNGSATDLEDGNLTSGLAWTSNVDGSLGSGGTVSAGLSEAAHTITASSTDSAGLTGTAEIAIVVGAPTVTISAPQDGSSFLLGQAIAFAGSATDALDGDLTASLTWSSDRDGPLGNGGTLVRSDLSLGAHRIRASATDSGGLRHEAEITVNVASDTPVLVGAGDIAHCGHDRDEATAKLLDGIAGTVFTAGDNAYPNGTDAEYTNCYVPTWGRHKARTRPAPGNHEYNTPGATGYFNYFGPAAGDPTRGYYSYDLAGWHIVVLNSECSQVGGCTSASPQGQWLAADLAAHPATCTLAYWHKPRFSSAQHGSFAAVQPLWEILYEARAEVVISGHDHTYERFARQDPVGVADPVRGIRQFVVGTGGASLYTFGTPLPNSEVRDNTAHGVLKLTLNAGSYDWEFIPVAGASFTDTGTENCVTTNQPPTAAIATPAPGSTFDLGDTVAFTGTGSDAEDGDLTSSLAWISSRDGALGVGGAITTSTLSRGSHVIIARATDSGGTTVSAEVSLTINGPPAVTIAAPPNGASFDVGTPVTFTGTATDVEQGNLSAGLTWTSSRDGAIGNGASFSTSGLTAGAHVVTAAAADARGLVGSAQVSVAITRPPTVTITAPANGSTVNPGVPVSFTGSANDAEDGNLTSALAWSSSLNGSIGTGGSFVRSDLGGGSHTIIASVTDSAGSVGSASITLVVNRAPLVSITQPANGASFPPGQSVAFAGTAVDPEQGGLTAALTWTSDRDGPLGSGGSFSTSTLSQGAHVITASATDSGGLTGSAQITVRIDQPPSVTILQPSDGSIFNVGAPVSFTGNASDAEDGELTSGLAWTSSRDGAIGAGGGFSTSTLSRGTHVITARATDSGGQTATALVNITIDGPPVVVISAPANGASFARGATVAFLGTASDAEDGNLTGALAWFSSLNGSIGTGGSFARSDLSPGTHAITASVLDSTAKSGLSGISITIVDQPLISFDKRVAVGADDAEEKAIGGVSLNNGGDLELVTDATVQTVGLRFAGVTIPRGATIRAAYIQFQADEAHSGATSLTIRGQAADNPASFTSSKFNVSTRTRTASAVPWASVPAWNTVGEAGLPQRTPDLSAIVQELVNRPGWIGGNAMAFIVTGSGRRTAESFEGGATRAPLLHVEYE